MSLRINNSNISQIRINGSNVSLAKINGEIVFQFNNATITLTFTDKTIKAISDKDGSYDFYYANDNGIISDYDKIVSFNLKANVTSSYTYLNSFNIAPYEATKIAVCGSGTTKILSSSSLPSQFLFDSSTYGSKLYSVGLISDTHIDGDGTDTADSINDLKKALTLFSNENVSFISHCGDVTENNRASDYTAYTNAVADNTIPIKTIAGNHDNYSTLESITGNSLYYEYIPDGTNDIYLFLGSYQASTTNPFSDEELTWLETKLEEYKNKRVFLFLHYYCDPVGDANNLDNDDLGTTEQALTFRNLMTTYKYNLVYFSGHSHLTYKMQELIATANINSATDTLPKRVHIPSNGRPRILSDGRITNDYVGCECAIMDVYENCIVIRGKDLTDNKFLPIANYLLDTTIQKIIKTFYGDSKQNTTPSPDYPQEIQSIVKASLKLISETDELLIPIDLKGNILAKVGDIADELQIYSNGDVNLVKNIRKYTFTGDENFTNKYGTNLFDVQKIFDSYPFISGWGISNYYKYNSIQSGINANTVHGQFALQKATSSYNIFFKNTNYSDATSFKSYLNELYTAGNPVEIYYPLLNPETISLGNIKSQIDAFGTYSSIGLETTYGI